MSHIRSLAEARFTLTTAASSGAQWASVDTTSAQLGKMASRGRLVNVIARMDTSSATTQTNVTFYLAKGTTLIAVPDDLDIIYESDLIAAPAESATNADLKDDLWASGACYARELTESFIFGFSGTNGGAAAVVWDVRLVFEVWG